jgi:hypothetical protein
VATIKKIILFLFAIVLLSSSVLGVVNTTGTILYASFDGNESSATKIIDRSNTGNGTVQNTSFTQGVQGVDCILNGCWYSTTNNQAINTINFAHRTNASVFAISVWLKINDFQKDWFALCDVQKAAPNAIEMCIFGDDTSNTINFQAGATTNRAVAVVDNTWYHLAVNWYYNGTTQIYINGALNKTVSLPRTDTVSDTWVSMSYWYSGANYGMMNGGRLDELFVRTVSWTNQDVSDLYNSGAACNPYISTCGTPYVVANFSVTATNEWNGSALNISVIVDGITYGPNITVSTALLQNDTALHNITVLSTNYFNRTYLNYNVSSNLAASLHQAEVCFNASAKVSLAAVSANNFTIGSTTRASCFNLSAGSYNVQVKKTGWYNQNQTFTITALENDTRTIANMSYANLTISAKDGSTNASLTGYNLTIKSLNFTAWIGETAGAVTNYSFYLINGTYNVTIDATGYELTNAQANVTVSGNTNYTFTLYKENSLQITIRDEITNARILSNITARFTNNINTWENVTNTGSRFVYNLTPDVYTILFYGSGYSTRTYTITVGNRTTQSLTAYMISSNYSTTLTIKNVDSADVISNVSVNMYKLINSTWTVVESKYSDISGRAVFYYDPIGSYKFYLSKTDYTDYVFFLNPILFSAYDVYMTKTSILNASQDYDGIAIIYAPSSFPNNNATTFNFIISSPDGLLIEYGINLTLPNGSKVGAVGVNAIGSQLSAVVNITNATAYDRVRLDYYYITSTVGRKNFTAYFPIEFNVSAADLTFLSNKNKTYGLGIFERILIVTLTVLFVVGIGTMVGQPIPAMALGLFCFGYMAFIGFVPLWAILPSMFIGILFLVWKSGGY